MAHCMVQFHAMSRMHVAPLLRLLVYNNRGRRENDLANARDAGAHFTTT